MKTLRLVAEVELTEKEYKQIEKQGGVVWDVNTPVVTICEKPVKFVSAYITPESWARS